MYEEELETIVHWIAGLFLLACALLAVFLLVELLKRMKPRGPGPSKENEPPEPQKDYPPPNDIPPPPEGPLPPPQTQDNSWLLSSKVNQGLSQAKAWAAGRRGYHRDGQPITLYHGCPDYAGALHIFDTGHFLIGSSQPSAMWFTDQFSYAVGKASHKGAVVEVYRKNGYELEYYNGHYIIRADGASPDYYYSSKALKTVRIWSPSGKKLDEKTGEG